VELVELASEQIPAHSSMQELEQWLWEAADILRGAVKPEKYGNYMLPLLFYKRLTAYTSIVFPADLMSPASF